MSRPLSVVINSYNRIDLLEGALSSLIQGLGEISVGSSIVVFDAGSTDGSVEHIQKVNREADIPIHLVQPEEGEDGSFAAGVNTAIEYVSKNYPELEWCLLYETDNYLQNPGAITNGIELLERQEKTAAVGFTVERHDGRKAGYGEKFPTATRFALGQRLSSILGLHEPSPSWKEQSGVRFSYADVVYTSPLLVDYECWREIGGMDQDAFPFTDSDIDLCWRFQKKGNRCAVLDTPGVVHDNRQVQSEWSEERVERFHRSRIKVILRHREVKREMLKAALLIRHTVEIAGISALCLTRQRPTEAIDTRLRLLKGVFSGYT